MEIDVMTRVGFDAIASSHGIRAAWRARIARLEAICDRLPGNPYGLNSGGRFRELESARFELIWLDHSNNSARAD